MRPPPRGDAAAASARGEAAISARFASIQGRFSRTNDATNASAACSGADTSTWPSVFTRRFTFLMRLRTTGQPRPPRGSSARRRSPSRRLAAGRPVRPHRAPPCRSRLEGPGRTPRCARCRTRRPARGRCPTRAPAACQLGGARSAACCAPSAAAAPSAAFGPSTTMTISPFTPRPPAPARSANSSRTCGSGPRTTSSCSFVSSRHTAASRCGKAAASAATRRQSGSGLVEHERRIERAQAVQQRGALGILAREEAAEVEAGVVAAAGHVGRGGGRGARQHLDRRARLPGRAHEAQARVRHARHARVRAVRDDLAYPARAARATPRARR